VPPMENLLAPPVCVIDHLTLLLHDVQIS